MAADWGATEAEEEEEGTKAVESKQHGKELERERKNEGGKKRPEKIPPPKLILSFLLSDFRKTRKFERS